MSRQIHTYIIFIRTVCVVQWAFYDNSFLDVTLIEQSNVMQQDARGNVMAQILIKQVSK